ncbi:MAG: ATPase [Desulfobacterales bacterium]|nr:ATPase [Desulfobacterales bacterium]
MIQIDAFSLCFQIVNFVILIFLLNAVLFKPIRKILSERGNKVKGLEQGIESLAESAAEKDSEFTEGLKSARTRGKDEKSALLQAASEEEKKVIENINRKAQAELTEVRKRILKDAEAVRVSLQGELDNIATAIGQKLLGRAV